jgi:IS5 family transposase
MTKKHPPTKTAGKPMGTTQKAKAEQIDQKPKAKYRLRNWAKYNESLKQRGSITLWIDEDVIRAWIPDPQAPKKRGGQQEYSDGAIECLLTVKAVFHLAYRQTEGFGCSISELLGVKLPIPDYTTLNRRAKELKVQLATSEKGSVHLVLDSTGLKVYGEGEWKVRKHGYSKRRTWRKLHLAVDEATGEIEAEVLTEARVDDAEVTAELLEQTRTTIEQMSADGAYDKEKVYQAAMDKKVANITVPPRRDAVLWAETPTAPHPRNTNLRRVWEGGRKAWKEENGYHRRSLAETAMFRFKTLFGDRLSAREQQRQKTEARIKCAALNRMTRLGMPQSYRLN